MRVSEQVLNLPLSALLFWFVLKQITRCFSLRVAVAADMGFGTPVFSLRGCVGVGGLSATLLYPHGLY